VGFPAPSAWSSVTVQREVSESHEAPTTRRPNVMWRSTSYSSAVSRMYSLIIGPGAIETSLVHGLKS
jgi:hypothetical protein